ncbi:MAG: hypothetical protein WAM42_22355 [Candidatus Nitrosopolaris sp.]|jgi:hypothetical protein
MKSVRYRGKAIDYTEYLVPNQIGYKLYSGFNIGPSHLKNTDGGL